MGIHNTVYVVSPLSVNAVAPKWRLAALPWPRNAVRAPVYRANEKKKQES
jgi:hypothetical protein